MEARVRLDAVVIGRPIDEVFAFLVNLENSPLWGRTLSTSATSDGPVGVGTMFREVASEDSEPVKETVITHLEAPTRYSYTSVSSNGIEERADVSLEEVAGGTRVQPVAEILLPGVPQEQEGAVVANMQTTVRGLLANLKDHLETH